MFHGGAFHRESGDDDAYVVWEFFGQPVEWLQRNKNSKLLRLSHQILDYIVSIDINLDLAEQYNPNTDEMLSAEKLTWNYSELYFTNKNFNI